MLSCLCAGHGCLLADEMGLGKTFLRLVFLMQLNRETDFHRIVHAGRT
jgi:SNF2 family DNA or RNA helicase